MLSEDDFNKKLEIEDDEVLKNASGLIVQQKKQEI